MDQKFVVATRFWEADATKALQATQNLRLFIENALNAGAEHVLVAVNVAEDKSSALDSTVYWGDKATVFPVRPWGYFVQPLNALLIEGRRFWGEGANILIASVEVRVNEETVGVLSSHLGTDTLVVGAALEGHIYSQGLHENANGRQVPWNTLCLWQARQLWRTGVPLIGDGPVDQPESKGVEELMTIAVQQSMWTHLKAVLVKVPGIQWDTSGFDPERLDRHEKKMASKVARPAAQLAEYGFTGPTVIHL